jgi:hypothetical protein
VLWLLVAASIVPSSPNFVTLIKEVVRSSETSVLTNASLCNIPEKGILQYNSFFESGLSKIIFILNPGQPRTLLQLKLVGILTINLFLT